MNLFTIDIPPVPTWLNWIIAITTISGFLFPISLFLWRKYFQLYWETLTTWNALRSACRLRIEMEEIEDLLINRSELVGRIGRELMRAVIFVLIVMILFIILPYYSNIVSSPYFLAFFLIYSLAMLNFRIFPAFELMGKVGRHREYKNKMKARLLNLQKKTGASDNDWEHLTNPR